MNLLVLLAICVAALALLWMIQAAALAAHGEPQALPLRYTTKAPAVRLAISIAIQLTWITVLLAFPFAIGQTPAEYFAARFPWPPPWGMIAATAGLMLASGVTAYAIGLAVGWVQPFAHFDRHTLRRKLLRRLITPLPLATMEEAVFRGILLEQLLVALPTGSTWTALAIVLTGAIFSSVHFIRRSRPDKPRLQPAFGLFLVGCVFGLAYIVGGRTLWLPIASHATAIIICETTRLWVVFRGRPLLVGYPECPQCGLIGATCVTLGGAALLLM